MVVVDVPVNLGDWTVFISVVGDTATFGAGVGGADVAQVRGSHAILFRIFLMRKLTHGIYNEQHTAFDAVWRLCNIEAVAKVAFAELQEAVKNVDQK